MRYQLSQSFLEERERFSLLHTCEHCVLFDPERVACVHRYPVEDHVESSLGRPGAELVFCKEFELR